MRARSGTAANAVAWWRRTYSGIWSAGYARCRWSTAPAWSGMSATRSHDEVLRTIRQAGVARCGGDAFAAVAAAPPRGGAAAGAPAPGAAQTHRARHGRQRPVGQAARPAPYQGARA